MYWIFWVGVVELVKQMQRLKSMDLAQRFLSSHARVKNLFHYGRQLRRAGNHRLLRDRWLLASRAN